MRLTMGLIALMVLPHCAFAQNNVTAAPATPLPAASPAAAPPEAPSPPAASPQVEPKPQQPNVSPTPKPPQATNLPHPPMVAAPARGSFVAGRLPGQALASSLRGRAVYDPSAEKIGTVDDLVIDPDGKVAAAVIGVGGFLGIGTKDVAVPFADLKTGSRGDDPVFVLNHTRSELKNAPAFAPAVQKRQ